MPTTRLQEDDGTIMIRSAIKSARVDDAGQWVLSLQVPSCDGPKVAALALQTQVIFETHFRVDADQMGTETEEQPEPEV